MTHFRWLLLTGLLALIPGLQLVGTPQESQSGLFTIDQATRGRELYSSKCAACHGTDLKGGTAPPLAGPVFAKNWSSSSPWARFRREPFTVDDLFFIMSTTMPPRAAGDLALEEHAAVLSYILQQNGYPSGNVLLRPDSPRLKQTKLLVGQPEPEARAELAPELIKGPAVSLPTGSGPTQAELNAASNSTSDWLYHTHDYSGSRFVALDQINSANASRLQAVCAAQLGEISTFQTGPIVYHGTMYVTTSQTTIALDASNCRPKWRYTWTPKEREVWPVSRGVGLKEGRVVRGTADGYLLALNAETGELIWARRVADSSLGETFTMPPLIYEDLILIGPAGSENAISGWIGAFRLSDGSLVWKFKTIAGTGDKDSESWPNPAGIKLGGGAVWTPFSFDTEKEELYVAVTNPAPDLPSDLRPGANLYTNSLLALDIRTGKLRWYKQMVPNDSHDWDLTQVSPLFRTAINGRERSLVATVGKDGVLRTVDRDSRGIAYQTPVTTIKNAEVPVTAKGVFACPGPLGGVEWNGPAFDPGTNTLYAAAVDWCATFWSMDKVRHIPGRLYMGGKAQREETSQGWVTAINASSGEIRWRYRSPKPMVAAVTTTKGHVVLTGELTGDFIVLDARTGAVLYRFNTGGPIGGGIVTYQLEGKQYVAVMSGRPSSFFSGQNPGAPTVFVFALP